MATYTIELHDYEVHNLIRLLAWHVVGEFEGPRGILCEGILPKLEKASGIDMHNTKPFSIGEGRPHTLLYLNKD